MGRVHKKKIAEYTEAEENKTKEKGAEVDGEKDAGSESENGEGSKDINDGAIHHDGVIATQSDDDEFKSLQGDTEVQQAKNSSNGNGGAGDAKKSHKRKCASNKTSTKIKSTKPADAIDEPDSDDEPLNGAAIAGTSKKRKIPVPSSSRKEKVSEKVSGKAGVRGSKREKMVAPGKKASQSSEEEEYEVKEIIDHKIERGVSFFLIRWKGYSKDDDTWERETTLNCSELIEKFKKKQAPNEPKSTKKITKPVKKGRGKKEDEEEKEWEVEKIMDFAEERSGRVFLIRWKGFSAKDDTWEPEENLNCSDIIEKFMKRIKSQENISVKELREEPKKTKRLVNETVRSFNNSVGRKSKRATTKKR